VIAVK